MSGELKRAKIMLGIVVFGLMVSAVTIWPAVTELEMGVKFFWGDGPATGAVHTFASQV